MVLIAVGLTAWAVAVPRNGWTLTGAGFVSGITGTATGIGGPPMGLVYQNAKGPQIRATLAMFFLFSAAQSLGILALLGKLPAQALTSGALLIPFLVVGFLASGRCGAFWTVDGSEARFSCWPGYPLCR